MNKARIWVAPEFAKLMKKRAVDENKSILQFTSEITDFNKFCDGIKPKKIKRNDKGYLDGFL